MKDSNHLDLDRLDDDDERRNHSFRELAALGDPDAAYAADLVTTVHLDEPGPAVRRRVWAALEERRARAPRMPLVAMLLRPATVMVVLLGLVAVAGATLAPPVLHRWLAKTPAVPLVMPKSAPPLAAPRATSRPAVSPTVDPALAAAAAAPAEAGLVAAPASRALPAARVDGAENESPDREVGLVVDSVNALRRDHHPERAAALLTIYRERYPHGVLAEEALVLAIEAATVAHDERQSATLGAAYLASYPAGRFTDVARAAAAAKP